MEASAIQLTLPEPPDTVTMWTAIKHTRQAWYDAIELRWNSDETYTTREYLWDRDEMESWYNGEAMRIDRIYADYYGVR